jgi:hypothetical protein
LDSGNNQASEQRYQAALLLGDATAAPTRATLAAAARLLASGAQLFLASPQVLLLRLASGLPAYSIEDLHGQV